MIRWMKQFFRWMAGLFKRKKPALDPQEHATETERPQEGIPISRRPGLNCPRCGFRIEFTIPQLTSGEPIYCHQCFLELRVDQEKSRGSLASLNKLQQGLAEAERIKNQG